ncbi:Hypothetical predicted protein [Pelobates cultripes]|uniref:Uncharacterized protein n=1 Tax=Pelobates cultripes TaxID=61616 RepID=A0AAD1ST76_PELCU|nr:Hypothetical predicted protein [Pelobates cultripes]
MLPFFVVGLNMKGRAVNLVSCFKHMWGGVIIVVYFRLEFIQLIYYYLEKGVGRDWSVPSKSTLHPILLSDLETGISPMPEGSSRCAPHHNKPREDHTPKRKWAILSLCKIVYAVLSGRELEKKQECLFKIPKPKIANTQGLKVALIHAISVKATSMSRLWSCTIIFSDLVKVVSN